MVPVLKEQIIAHREADPATGRTAVVPHRSEFEVPQERRRARDLASQGQQRAAAPAIRLGAAALAETLTEKRPVLLVDDVLSELDARSRAGVFEACRSVEQVVLTSADCENAPAATRQEGALREVWDGQVG